MSVLHPVDLGAAVDQVTRHQHDVILDALLEAWPAYWERRAQSFEAARPDPSRDFTGQASVEDLRSQWHRLTAIAAACRARGAVSPLEFVAREVRDVLDEVA